MREAARGKSVEIKGKMSDKADLIGYMQACLGRLELWLRDCRVAINVCKSTAVLSAKAARGVRQPWPVQFLGGPTEWVETARCIGVTLDTRLTWSAHVNKVR
jgi:hypothetical protein